MCILQPGKFQTNMWSKGTRREIKQQNRPFPILKSSSPSYHSSAACLVGLPVGHHNTRWISMLSPETTQQRRLSKQRPY